MSRLIILASFTTIVAGACGSKSAPAKTTPPPTVVAPAETAPPETTPPETAPPAPAETKPPAPDPEKIKADLLAAEQDAYAKAKPAFEQYCAKCHQQGGKMAKKKTLGHFDMTAYPFGGHHTATMGATIREVLALDGGKPKMPFDKPGSVKPDDLALIAAWTEAWAKADEGGAHGAKAGHDQLDDDHHD